MQKIEAPNSCEPCGMGSRGQLKGPGGVQGQSPWWGSSCAFQCRYSISNTNLYTRPDSSSRRTIQLRSVDVLHRVATWVLRNGATLQPLPRSYCVGTRQRGAMLQRSHAVTLQHSTWTATVALHRSCHHCTCLLEYAEVTSIICAAADDWLTLPGSERHGTIEVELQSTAVTIKFCQASKRRVIARQ